LIDNNIILTGEFMKKAFTLAEVLITLGIIGVVAAMTIPSLLQTYAKKRTAAQLKESYSIVQQAIRLSENDNGEAESWDVNLNGHDFFHKYLANYVKWQNEYTTTELNKIAPRKHLDGSNYTGTFYTQNITSHFSLINGAMISVQIETNGLFVGIDVNGVSKPNRMGIDTFFFFFSNQYGLVPNGGPGTPSLYNYGQYSRSTVLGTGNQYACNKKKKGYWCAALIMQDGWQISSDYPWI